MKQKRRAARRTAQRDKREKSAERLPLSVQHLPPVEGDEIGGQVGIGLTEGGADAVLAASLFHYKELEISQVKDYLAGKGVPVRR